MTRIFTETIILDVDCMVRILSNKYLAYFSSQSCTFYQQLHRQVFHTHYCSGDQAEKDEMSRACSTYGGERCIQGFGGET